MPNTKSAERRMRNSARKQVRNTSVKSRLKTAEKGYLELLTAGKKDEAAIALQKGDILLRQSRQDRYRPFPHRQPKKEPPRPAPEQSHRPRQGVSPHTFQKPPCALASGGFSFQTAPRSNARIAVAPARLSIFSILLIVSLFLNTTLRLPKNIHSEHQQAENGFLADFGGIGM
jgi:hypothetical protein